MEAYYTSQKRCVIGWNHKFTILITLRNKIIKKKKLSGQVFPQFWGFEARGNFVGFLKIPFVPFILLNMTVSISRVQFKNRFKKQTTLGWFIWEKKQNGVVVWFSVPCLKMFLQISRPRVVCFSNRFLHWNLGINMVVLSLVKGTNRVKKSKNAFSFRHLWPEMEWNQVKYPSVLIIKDVVLGVIG